MTFAELSSPRTIIAFNGRAESGKDTAAQYLTHMHSFHRIAFADGVRDALYALNPLVCVEQAITTHGAIYDRVATVVDTLGWDTAKQIPDIRALMQRIGTEAGWRIHGEHLWVNLAIKKINELPADHAIVITDLRFPNEIEWLNSLKANPMNTIQTVKVIRPDHESTLTAGSFGTTSHISESFNLTTDTVLRNDGTIDDLHSKLADFLSTSPQPVLSRSAPVPKHNAPAPTTDAM